MPFYIDDYTSDNRCNPNLFVPGDIVSIGGDDALYLLLYPEDKRANEWVATRNYQNCLIIFKMDSVNPVRDQHEK